MYEEDEQRRRIYNIRDLPGKKRKRGGGEAPRKREELGIYILGRGVLSSWDIGPSDPVFLASI